MARIYLGGPSGCGKTTVGKRIALQHPGILSVVKSEIMMRGAGVSSRQELEQLPEETKQFLRTTLFENYYKNNPRLIIDGHFYIGEADVKYVDSFVYIDVDTDRLIELRASDAARQRSINPYDIEMEREQLQERISQLRELYGISVTNINNNGTLDEFTQKIEGIYFSYETDEHKREIRGNSRERL